MAITMRESVHSPQNQIASLLTLLLFALAVMQPGVAVGAGFTLLWWHLAAPSLRVRLLFAIAASLPFRIVSGSITWLWPWRLFMPHFMAGVPVNWTATPHQALVSVAAEAFAGPAFAAGVLFIKWTREGMPAGMLERERRRLAERQRNMPATGPSDGEQASFLLGYSKNGRAFDLSLPGDLAQHVTVLGKMGSGKTTTAARLIEGVCLSCWPVIIVDAKGFGSLRSASVQFAARFSIPLRLVAPDDAESLRYNPCTGTAAQVSNKLIGAFSFGENAEIYKNIAQEVLPVLVRALRAAGREVTLASLARSLSPEGMVGLSRNVPADDMALADYLRDLADRKVPYPAGYAGMRSRLSALLQGMYGELLTPGSRATLDLGAALAEPSITYISLPAMEGSEDVELMARVIAQDLKQVAASRIAHGESAYALLVLDEFAALREASQLNDLLLQAREARIACVVATQFLPSGVEAAPLRHALLSAGAFLAHQCSADDAEAVAAVFGTRRTVEVTHQVDYATGSSEKGSMRSVDQFRVHPNELRDLPRGTAAVRIEPGERRIALVQVERPAEMKGELVG